jgi:Tol biopolymer transport system component/DNA-binding winged helix-turn-helix (wHTH) protein
MSTQTNGLYEFGPYRLDIAKRLLTRAGENIPLAPKTFDLLLLLAESPGRALTKAELMQALWPDTFVEEASLSFQMSTLRKALGEEGAHLIETVPKHGYRFAVTVTGTDGVASAKAEPAPRPAPRPLVPWAIAALATLAALILSIPHLREASPAPRITKSSLLPPEKTAFVNFAVSPDGRRLAFTARGASGRTQLWVRPLESLIAQPLAGTEGASHPFWSPDSRFIAFFADRKLKKIDASGGPAQNLCTSSDFPRGGTWGRRGVIVFAQSGSRLYQVSEAGGDPQPLTALDRSRQEMGHPWPHFLPDGRHFIHFINSGQPKNSGVYLGSLDSKDTKRLAGVDSGAVYTGPPAGSPSPGHLLFMREQALMAQPFDAARSQLVGEPVRVAEPVGFGLLPAQGLFSVSDNGVLVYDATPSSRRWELVWFDRTGRRLGVVGPPDRYGILSLAPDEKRVAVSLRDPKIGTLDLWLFELTGGANSRFTFLPGSETEPVWSPDGSRIVFYATPGGPFDLYQKTSSGSGSEELLLHSTANKMPSSWSRDGRFLLYGELDPKNRSDIWILPLAGERKPVPFVRSESDARRAEFSPDGRWIAYQSNESGRYEIYVQPFPAIGGGAGSGAGGKWQVSTGGGTVPKWRGDGKEFYYLATDLKMMAAEVKASGNTFAAGVPRPLFQTRAVSEPFAVTSDGQRFLILTPMEEIAPSPLTVVVNWQGGLKR